MASHAVTMVTTQIGPYEWETAPRVLNLTPETTLAEIEAWYRKVHRTPVDPPFSMRVHVVTQEGDDG